MEIFINWENLNYLWSDIQYPDGDFMNWEDIFLIEEVSSIMHGGGGSQYFRDYVEGNPWKKMNEQIGKQKTDRFIKIFCTVNNIEYEKMIKINENIKVSVSQFEKVFNEAVKIKVNFKE